MQPIYNFQLSGKFFCVAQCFFGKWMYSNLMRTFDHIQVLVIVAPNWHTCLPIGYCGTVILLMFTRGGVFLLSTLLGTTSERPLNREAKNWIFLSLLL